VATKARKEWRVKNRIWLPVTVAGAMLLTGGCASLFPSKTTTVESLWKNYAEIDAAFGKIIPYQTNTNDLRTLGFDPSVMPNLKLLNHSDIVKIFLPNSAIEKKDLPGGVRDCIESPEQSYAYQIELAKIHSKRYGNLFLDLFGFRRKTHETGWEFKGLILIKSGIVAYKTASGQPEISRNEKQVKPLGPLQDIDGVSVHLISIGPQ
jgi:hypothetical protein